jgi:hypothetical protein
MKTVLVCLGMIFCLVVSGCGGPENVVSEKVQGYDPLTEIKANVGSVAESGRMGSGIGQVYSAIKNIEKKDAAKAASIRAMIDEMTAITDAAKLKAKAKEILAKL